MSNEHSDLQKEIKEFIKNNLRLDVKKCSGDYGYKSFLEIKPLLCGDEISYAYIDTDSLH